MMARGTHFECRAALEVLLVPPPSPRKVGTTTLEIADLFRPRVQSGLF